MMAAIGKSAKNLQLREFGWTQQQIADCLSTDCLRVPRQTIGYWLQHFGNGTSDNVSKLPPAAKNDIYSDANINRPPIRLFPYLYEEAAATVK